MLFVVAYHEFADADAQRGARALAGRATALAGRDSVKEAAAFAEIGQSNRCVLFERWTSEDAQKAQAADTGLEELEIAPPDVRLHHAWSVGNAAAAAAGSVFVFTHIDVPPTHLPALEAIFRPFAEESRTEKGALRFDAVQSSSRPNHFTLIEGWGNEAARRAHATAAHMRSFRAALNPLLGALYDQRLYSRIA